MDAFQTSEPEDRRGGEEKKQKKNERVKGREVERRGVAPLNIRREFSGEQTGGEKGGERGGAARIKKESWDVRPPAAIQTKGGG